jgi:GalNAc-alpha-(1->4)-GalNAc-alpha-(1->3)-diNAcBac-PP-undecaprenol alpha-1,4-N-acetyl-D-galactosaminyltransferase
MKIMFVIHSLNKVGGAEKILTLMANYLVLKNYDISIVILSNLESTYKLDKRIKFIKMKEIKKNSFIPQKLKPIVGQIGYLTKTTRTLKPDIIVSFISAVNILSIISAKLTKTPIIISEHSSYHLTLTPSRGKINALFWRLLRRLTYPYVSHLIILTEEDKPKYYYVSNLSVIKNPLILQNNHQNIRRKNIILGVGRLETIKGFDMLIHAFSKLNLENWKLLIAGEGSQRKELEKQIEALNMSNNIELLGLVNDMELYYKQSSIYVLSSISEGFPGGLCEAMAYGCASIAFDCPTGPKEIINDGINGILIQPNNIMRLSIQIEKLTKDKARRELLGLASQKIIHKLDIKIISQEWESIFNDITKHDKGNLK